MTHNSISSHANKIITKNSRHIISLFQKTVKSKSEIPEVKTEQVPDRKTNVRS